MAGPPPPAHHPNTCARIFLLRKVTLLTLWKPSLEADLSRPRTQCPGGISGCRGRAPWQTTWPVSPDRKFSDLECSRRAQANARVTADAHLPTLHLGSTPRGVTVGPLSSGPCSAGACWRVLAQRTPERHGCKTSRGLCLEFSSLADGSLHPGSRRDQARRPQVPQAPEGAV